MENLILDVLRKLDVTNDQHWTADGMARLDTVKMLGSNPAITREMIDMAAPGFTRVTAPTYVVPTQAIAPVAPAAPVGAGSATPAPAAVPEATEQGGADSAASFSTPSAQQPKVDESAGDPTDEISSLEAELEEADAAVEKIRGFMVKATDELNARVAVADALRIKLDGLQPANSGALAVQDYFASVDAAAAQRIANQKVIAESGVDLKALVQGLALSEIDSAMARRTKRGTQRPTRL